MKTKMKTILSLCMLTVLLYACTKKSATPEPVLDCMGVESGVAAYDDCGDCQQAYLYNFTTHNPMDIVMLGGDTNGAAAIVAAAAATDTTIMIILPEHPMNSYWNSSCTDCMGILNGLAAVDDSSCCHESYMYLGNGALTPISSYADTVGLDGLLILAGSAEDIANNPSWNIGCK